MGLSISRLNTGDDAVLDIQIAGGTDGTIIGNTSDKLRVEIAGLTTTAVAMINRTDVNTTVTASGTSATFDSEGHGTLGFTVNISAASGTSPTLQATLRAAHSGDLQVRVSASRRQP